jgi:glycine cleavage system aminomethyltransferase T
VRPAVGLFYITCYAKHEIAGPDAAAWLRRLNLKVPRQERSHHAFTNAVAQLIGGLPVTRLAGERFLLVGAGANAG